MDSPGAIRNSAGYPAIRPMPLPSVFFWRNLVQLAKTSRPVCAAKRKATGTYGAFESGLWRRSARNAAHLTIS